MSPTTYTLRRTSPNTQILDSHDSLAPFIPSYALHTRATGGFLNKKPHMVISRTSKGITNKCAEVRFEVYGTGTTVHHYDTGVTQSLALESSLEQRYVCTANGGTCWWQPTGPKREELELRSKTQEVLASFTYTGPVALQTGPGTGNKQNSRVEVVGDLQVGKGLDTTTEEIEMVVCSALAVVERAKRRAANVGKQASAYRQGVACGPGTMALGGGL